MRWPTSWRRSSSWCGLARSAEGEGFLLLSASSWSILWLEVLVKRIKSFPSDSFHYGASTKMYSFYAFVNTVGSMVIRCFHFKVLRHDECLYDRMMTKWTFNCCCTRFNATRHPRHVEAAVIVMYSICTALLLWIAHEHLAPLSFTKRRPVHFIFNSGHVEYELGVLMVRKLSRPERDSNLQYPAWKSSALITRPPTLINIKS